MLLSVLILQFEMSILLTDSQKTEIIKEIKFQAVRSSGPGGQNVNKVSSKVELRFNVNLSSCLSPEQKKLLTHKLLNKLTTEGELIITAQEDRSQLKNKQIAIEKLLLILNLALTPPKRRKPTRPTRTSVEKRLSQKKQHSNKKNIRGKFDYE